jgi:hypothetical protein
VLNIKAVHMLDRVKKGSTQCECFRCRARFSDHLGKWNSWALALNQVRASIRDPEVDDFSHEVGVQSFEDPGLIQKCKQPVALLDCLGSGLSLTPHPDDRLYTASFGSVCV